MPYSSSWDVIGDAESSQIVLSVDFHIAKRAEASFAELARRIGSRYRFLQTRLPAVQHGQQLSAATYVSPWIEEIRRERCTIVAVLGHSYGCVYAAAIAEGIAQWQQLPAIILFNPQVASIRLLGREFRREIDSISSLLSDDELERTRTIATEISESTSANVADAAAEVIRVYREVSVAAYERVGLGGACGDRFVKSFESCLSCISMADQIDPSSAWKRSTAIVSSDYLELRTMMRLANGAGSPIGHRILLNVEHAGMLRSASAAQQFLALLEPSHLYRHAFLAIET